jgi:hypothetical protein
MVLKANSTIEAEMAFCRDLESSLNYQFIDDEKDLPTSWDDFAEIGMIKKKLLPRNSIQLKTINSLALVPGAPVIHAQPGIPGEYQGHRLFLISRTENITKPSGPGRYAILIKPEELDSRPIRTYSYFIPEETAQIILKQIKGFDPQEQPLAFEDVDRLEHDKKAEHDQATQEIKKHLKKPGKLGPDDQIIPDDQYSKWWERYGLVWIAGGIILTAFLIWIALRKRLRC